MKKISLILVLVFYFLPNYILSQIDPIPCETTTASGSAATSWGRYKPAQNSSGEYFRVLIAFAQFATDATQNSDWPLNQLPNWANSFIASTVSGSYANETISDYFDKASVGKFDFIGDVYPNLITISTNKSYGAANLDVITTLNANISDFSRYDNWSFNGTNHVFSEGNGDGNIDMLIVIYRNSGTYFGIAGGIANINLSSNFTTHDGKIFRSGSGISTSSGGITTRAGLVGKFNMITHIAHEYGHYLFGADGSWHTNFGGLMASNPYESETYMMGGWERLKLGYITPTVPSSDGQQITLGDFVTSGDAIRINVNSSTYFLIENHQRVSNYDQIMRGGAAQGLYTFNTSLGSGIYIWLITNGTSWIPTITPKTADGFWNWTLDGTINMPAGWPSVMPLTERSAVNRNTGKSDRHPQNIQWDSDGNGITEWWAKWHENIDPNITNPPTNFYVLNRSIMGDEADAFNLGHNELFTPWSNPSSYAGGTTNISVELVSKSGNNIAVKVYSTSTSALALAPSKPQNVKILFTDPNHPTVGWDLNIESDISNYEVYRSYDNGSFSKIATVSSSTSSYSDTEISYDKPIFEKDVRYKIKAKDSTAKLSIFSNEAKTEGVWDLLQKNSGDKDEIIAGKFSLNQNYPNPFNPTTIVSYNIPEIV